MPQRKAQGDRKIWSKQTRSQAQRVVHYGPRDCSNRVNPDATDASTIETNADHAWASTDPAAMIQYHPARQQAS